MSNETTKVVTKVIDVRHKAPDQAIHELMQAAKDGFAVTKIATRFNHTHVYLETSSSQLNKEIDQKTFNETVDKLVEKELVDKEVAEKAKTAGANSDGSETKESEVNSGEVVGKEPTKVEPVKSEVVKPVTKKVTSKTTTAKKVKQGDKDAE